ncbi:MAG TPA: chemotaxis protein CheW [Casimicrobiaceae bacterium]|nr:chemotaxis protein CheW [Casimicrobiaceae bacterium]
MSRAARLDLRSFQQELATRLASKTAAQVESSRLGVGCGGARYLIRLGDAGEVIAVPPVVPVPLTKAWFLGLANIRGNLVSVIDFAAFQGEAPLALGGLARLIVLSTRNGFERAGIVVERVLGLRNLAQFERDQLPERAPAWQIGAWHDAEGCIWREMDLGTLSRDPAFLQVGT